MGMLAKALVLTAVTTLAVGVVAVAAPAPDAAPTQEQQKRLTEAKAQSAAAAARSERLERQAANERDQAKQARTQEAAVAARIQQAEANLAAGQARTELLRSQIVQQRTRLDQRQGPVVRLVAALQSFARRPALLSVVQPGSISDTVHVRAVLASTLPVIRARTADVRSDLARTRRLQGDAVLAANTLSTARRTLEEQRLVLTRLEAEHRLRSRELGRGALVESDRAIALGERARDIVDLMDQLGDQATVRESLMALPGPLPRPPRPGETATPVDTISWSAGAPPYRLPVAGRIVTGLGELSDAGVRSRGLTLVAAPAAEIVAPAAGRIAYAAPFRHYGVVVIIDHGDGWTTLLSGLAKASVRVGENVDQGGAIGQAGQGDDPRITVELRRKGRAIDMTPLIG